MSLIVPAVRAAGLAGLILPSASQLARDLPPCNPYRWWPQGLWIAPAERASQWTEVLRGDHLLQATGANQPIAPAWNGANYLWNRGVAANALTATSVSITGNVCFTLDVALDDYTPGASYIVASKISGNNGFALVLLTTGALQWRVGDGAAITSYNSTATLGSLGINDFDRIALTIAYTDGGSGQVVFSVNGQQIGAAVPTTKTLTNAAIQFIPFQSTSVGKFFGATITNGASTTYYNVSTAGVAEGTTSFVGVDGNAYSVLQSGATPCQIIRSQQMLGDGLAYFMRASYTQAQPVTRIIVGRPNVWTSGTYLTDGVGADSAAIKQVVATPQIAQRAGGGGSVNNVNAALGAYHAIVHRLDGSNSLLNVDGNVNATLLSPGVSAPGGLTWLADGGSPTAATYGAWQGKEIVEYNRALTASEINEVLRWASTRHRLGLSI